MDTSKSYGLGNTGDQVTAPQVAASSCEIRNTLVPVLPKELPNAKRPIEELPPLIDIHNLENPTDNVAVKEPSSRSGRRQKKRRRGGWPITKYITNNEVLQILNEINTLERNGTKLTHFLTFRPPPSIEGDQPQKLWCRRQIQNFRRKLARKKSKFLALCVYEKNDHGPVHAHLLVHIPKWIPSIIPDLHRPPETHVVLARPDHKSYVTKNRRWQGPAREKWLREKIGLRWKKGASFRGKRWGWTSDAKLQLTKALKHTSESQE